MAKYDPDIHHRRSIRLAGYDYSQPGHYFVTLCTKHREQLFGRIDDGENRLNVLGEIVQHEWVRTSRIRTHIELGVFVVMPNHFHGIIHIVDYLVGAHCHVPLRQKQIEQFGKSTKNTIPTIIKLFKSSVTKKINIIRGTPGLPVWQRNYYEHIIRDQDDYNRIQEYIQNNPSNWEEDECHS